MSSRDALEPPPLAAPGTAPEVPPDPGASARILVVDDEKNIRRTLTLVLEGEGYDVLQAQSAEEALGLLQHGTRPVDLAIVDLFLPGLSGLELLARLRSDEGTRELPVLVISGHASVQDAVQALKLGAGDFFEKPLSRERIVVGVRNALKVRQLAREVEDLSAEREARYQMIGDSPPMKRLYLEIDRVAPTRASVLITGESGTGKELVSRAIHRLSSRAKGPFVKVNCAAIPRELIESELFGHERGAFTGAEARKRGFFEQAHGGTLFLDEIGDMDLAAQAKVLRALQSGEVCRVGSEHVLELDVRVLAATNKDLPRAVARGAFREDLYFRLAVFPIRTPSLRERTGDLRGLAEMFLQAFCRENGLRTKGVDPAVFALLERRRFPGNVRELRNVIERAAILSGDKVTVADLPEDPHASPFEEEALTTEGADAPDPGIAAKEDDEGLREEPAEGTPSGTASPGSPSMPPPGMGSLTLREFRERAERDYIVEVLRGADWNVSKAAVILGVERTNLHKKIRGYGIRRGESR